MDEIEQDLSGFLPIYSGTQLVGVTLVVLMAVWTGHTMGGFAGHSDPEHLFNWHPLLLTLSFIYLYGNGLLIYRVFRHERKKTLKVAHAAVMVTAVLLACLGVKAAWDSHSLRGQAQLYSLHSWMGLLTLTLSVGQAGAGFVTFLWPGLASHFRARYMSVHVFIGMLTFILACVTALLGLSEKAIWRLDKKYEDKSGEGILVNSMGILVVLFCGLVMYLVTNSTYKRLERPEDMMLLVDNNVE